MSHFRTIPVFQWLVFGTPQYFDPHCIKALWNNFSKKQDKFYLLARKSLKRAPGVSEMDLPGVRGPESATLNEISSFRKSSSLSSWSWTFSIALLGVTAKFRDVIEIDGRKDGARGDESVLVRFHSSHHGGRRSRRWARVTQRFSSPPTEMRNWDGFW